MKLPRRMLALAAALFVTVTLARATLGPAFQTQLGNPDSAATTPLTPGRYLIARPQYALSYNNATREANWVSWSFTSSDRGSVDRTDDFAPDPLLPAGFNVIDENAYRNSGYDRGHLCPSADRTLTVADNQATFFMTNMVPQTPDNNQGIWAVFEQYTRDQAALGFEALVLSGPSGFTTSTLASGVAVPGYTWKIVVLVPEGPGSALSRITAATRVIALKVPNIAGIRSTPWMHFITSAGQLQEDTGLTFFSTIANASIRAALLAKIDGQPAGAAPSRLANLSTRTFAGPGDQIAITGFVLAGDVPKPVLIRAVGPGLRSFGVSSVLTTPTLQLRRGDTLLASNTGWSTAANAADIADAAAQAGAFALTAGSADSALLTTLAPGPYTAAMSSSTNAAGVALLEVYELPPAAPNARLINLSVRSIAGIDDQSLLAGVVISGAAQKRLLLRAAGPALGNFGVANALARPELILRSSTGRLIARNAGWSASPDSAAITAASARAGAFAFPPGSLDAALLLDLAPGDYTAQVVGLARTTGVALLEVYELP